ncbi:M23 family metallopeptidase [Erysipelotrichaceae bacterium OttesenSCG-928-M19]|nr:M23 family metallopeptidase [Erysipelotrichaceae bacterium OttesenSCG-928-M19]
MLIKKTTTRLLFLLTISLIMQGVYQINAASYDNVEKKFNERKQVIEEIYFESDTKKIRKEFFYNNDDSLARSIDYDYETKQYVSESFYSPQARYENKTREITYRNTYQYENGKYLKKSYRYDYSLGKYTHEFIYENKTKFKNRADSLRYQIIYEYKNDLTLSKAIKYDYKTKQYLSEYYYKVDTDFKERETNYDYRLDFYYNSDNTINNIQEYNYDQTNYHKQYFFKADTIYGNHFQYLLFSYLFEYDKNNFLVKTLKYDYLTKHYLSELYYDDDTQFSERSTKLSYYFIFYYDKDDNLVNSFKYDYKIKQFTYEYIYYPNTYYGDSHDDKIKKKKQLLFSSKLVLPLKSGIVSATAWSYQDGGWHPAVDIATPINSPIYAPANGEILMRMTTTTGYGIHMVTIHQIGDDTFTFIYGHLNKQGNKDKFLQGDIIGYTGTTGNSTGPHLHLEIIKHPNQSLNEVKQKFASNQDYWFGLGYHSIGNCKIDTVCRLNPIEYFNLNYQQAIAINTVQTNTILSNNYLDNVRKTYSQLSFGTDALYTKEGLSYYKIIADKVTRIQAKTKSEQELKKKLEHLLTKKTELLKKIVYEQNKLSNKEKDEKINREIIEIIY